MRDGKNQLLLSNYVRDVCPQILLADFHFQIIQVLDQKCKFLNPGQNKEKTPDKIIIKIKQLAPGSCLIFPKYFTQIRS